MSRYTVAGPAELMTGSMTWNARSLEAREFSHSGLNFFYIKGTVSVILSDPSCKEGNVRFTTVPYKPLSDQV